MEKLYLMTALALGLVAPAHAETYLVNFDTDNEVANVTGTIVTTCNSCALKPGNISSWAFALDGKARMSSTDGIGVVTLHGTSPLRATPSGVIFNPTVSPQGSFIGFGDLDTPDFSGEPSLVFEAREFSSVLYGEVVDERGNVGVFADSLGQAPLEIALRAPEPSTWALLLSGFGLMAALGLRKARKDRLSTI